MNRYNTLISSSYKLVNNRVAAVYWSPYMYICLSIYYVCLNIIKPFVFHFRNTFIYSLRLTVTETVIFSEMVLVSGRSHDAETLTYAYDC